MKLAIAFLADVEAFMRYRRINSLKEWILYSVEVVPCKSVCFMRRRRRLNWTTFWWRSARSLRGPAEHKVDLYCNIRIQFASFSRGTALMA